MGWEESTLTLSSVPKHVSPGASHSSWGTVKDNFICPNICSAFHSYNTNHYQTVYARASQPDNVFSLLCYLCPIIPNRFPSVYLSVPSVTRDINICVGCGGHSPKYTVQRHNSLSRVNKATGPNLGCCKLPPAANNSQMFV